MKKSPHVSFVLTSCVALALSACNQKTAAEDPAKARQLQELQSKIEALNTRSDELSHQLASREAADEEARREQLSKDQAEVTRQKEALDAERQALAAATPINDPQNTSSDPNETSGPAFQGKPAGYGVFYTKLQSDGDWIDSDDYGYIWQPTVARRNSRWRPYTDGRWVETERGWTWDSNERFGWATYHYGRWVDLDGSGWCWIPGNEWAPAWVSWRSSDQYVGWAPLQPEARLERGGRIDASTDVGYDTGPGAYSFVSTEDFGEDTYVGRVVEPERNVTIIDQTVNVTNITYNQSVINNYGPNYDDIGRRSRRPINRYRLDLDHRSDFAESEGSHVQRGDRLAVVAPVFAANSREDRNVKPDRVEKKIIKAPRENGWRGVNPAQREAVQLQLRKQANQQAQREQIASQRQRQQAAKVEQQAPPAEPSQPVLPARAAQTAGQDTPPPAAPVRNNPRPNPPAVAAQQRQRAAAQAKARASQANPEAAPANPPAADPAQAPAPAQAAAPSAAQLQQQAANRARRQREIQEKQAANQAQAVQAAKASQAAQAAQVARRQQTAQAAQATQAAQVAERQTARAANQAEAAQAARRQQQAAQSAQVAAEARRAENAAGPRQPEESRPAPRPQNQQRAAAAAEQAGPRKGGDGTPPASEEEQKAAKRRKAEKNPD